AIQDSKTTSSADDDEIAVPAASYFAKTDQPNKASIEELEQLRPDGTSIALAFATPAEARRYFLDSSTIQDSRARARSCQKEAAAAKPADICQFASGFRETAASSFTERYANYAKNLVLVRPDGRNEILFDKPVTITHGEFAIGATTDYLVVSY